MKNEMNFEQKEASRTFDLYDHTVVIRVAKAGYQQELKLSDMAQASVLELIRYGAQRWLNDKTGGADKTPAEVDEIIKNNMEVLLSEEGWQATRKGSSKVALSPVAKIIFDLASSKIKDAIKTKGLTLKEVGKEKIETLVEQYIDKNKEALETIAQAQIKQAQALDSISLDL